MTSDTERAARRGPCGDGGAPSRGILLGVACAILGGVLAGGCALATELKPTEPTAVTQQLVMRSLERAMAHLDVARFQGRRAALDVFAHAGNQTLMRAFVAAWLEEHGVRITKESPDLTLQVFVSALGTDRGHTLIGIPAFQAPVVGIPVPEIALFKWVRNRGLAEVTLYAFDARTGAFVDKDRPREGRAKHDDYTVLLVIDFTVTDVDKRPE
jgi:hypothetical protein